MSPIHTPAHPITTGTLQNRSLRRRLVIAAAVLAATLPSSFAMAQDKNTTKADATLAVAEPSDATQPVVATASPYYISDQLLLETTLLASDTHVGVVMTDSLNQLLAAAKDADLVAMFDLPVKRLNGLYVAYLIGPHSSIEALAQSANLGVNVAQLVDLKEYHYPVDANEQSGGWGVVAGMALTF